MRARGAGPLVSRLLRLHRKLGRTSGPLFTHADGQQWTQTYMLQRIMRPMLHRLQAAGIIHGNVVVDDVTGNTFRRGGLTHARDRLHGMDHRMLVNGHGRWSTKEDDRGHLPVPDRYDGLGCERKLVVTAAMW